jgi:hypothetical protein
MFTIPGRLPRPSGSRTPVGVGSPARSAGRRSAPCAAHRGTARTGCGRCSRGTRASLGRRDRSASTSRRSVGATTAVGAWRPRCQQGPGWRPACTPSAWSPWPTPPVRHRGPVAPAATVAGDLTADRRGRATQLGRDHPQRPTRGQTSGDLLAFGQTQASLRSVSRVGHDPAAPHQVRRHRAGRKTKRSSRRLHRMPGSHPPPDLINVCR